MPRVLKNNMGEGWAVSKDEKGRTVYTSADGRLVVRATGARFGSGYSPWKITFVPTDQTLYAGSLAMCRRDAERCGENGWF